MNITTGSNGQVLKYTSNVPTWSTANSFPDAPTIGTATAGDLQATIAFTPPVNNGGSTITSYTVFSNPQERVAIGTSSPITITGLTRGTNYNFKVTATNDTSTSLASSLSNTILVLASPSAPTITNVSSGNGQVVVAFTAPSDNGGATITGYTATSNPGGITGTVSQSGDGTITVNGLSYGIAYTFTITATNGLVTSAESAASDTVTLVPVISGAPSITSVTSGNRQVAVSFIAPSYNGGATITNYTATSNPGGITGSVSQSGGGTLIVNGLTNGTAYTFTVTATNSVGTSIASTVSNSVTPVTVPNAPTITSVISGNGQVVVAFTAPADNGGATITGYTATSSPGGITGTVYQSGDGTIIVGGLTNGTAYTFKVKATNSVGTSIASAVSNSVIPATVPNSPTVTSVTSNNGQVIVAFTAPADNGGATITNYTATSSPGGITGTVFQSGDGTISVSGLNNGTVYTFTVTATNAVGTSVASTVEQMTYTILDNYTNNVPTGTSYVELENYNQYIDAGSIDASPFVITKLTSYEGGILFYGSTELNSTANENTFRLTSTSGNFDFISFNLDNLETYINNEHTALTIPKITLTSSTGSTITFQSTVNYDATYDFYMFMFMDSGVKTLNWNNVEWVDIKTQYAKAKTKDYVLKNN